MLVMKRNSVLTAAMCFAAALLITGVVMFLPMQAHAATSLKAGKTASAWVTNEPATMTYTVKSGKERVSFLVTPAGVSDEEVIVSVSANGVIYEKTVFDTPDYDEEGEIIESTRPKPWQTKTYCFKAGTKIAVKYFSNPMGSAQIKVKTTVKTPKYAEKEDNNKSSRANAVKLSKKYTAISHYKDSDWFVFTAPKKGSYKIALKADSNAVRAQYYIGSKAKGKLASGDEWVKSEKIKLQKGQKLRIKVAQVKKEREAHNYFVKVQKA